ncbi:hypothetical protein UlMin_008093 [Ulmus minor]
MVSLLLRLFCVERWKVTMEVPIATKLSPFSCSASPTNSPLLMLFERWFCGHMRTYKDVDDETYEEKNSPRMFGSDEEVVSQVPTQVQTLVEGSGSILVSDHSAARTIGFLGTQNMRFMHQELIEILSYAMVKTPELLKVILPQSLKKQLPESQELLSKVNNVIEKPHNDHLPLIEANSNCIVWKNYKLCNMDIISHIQQVICFAFREVECSWKLVKRLKISEKL